MEVTRVAVLVPRRRDPRVVEVVASVRSNLEPEEVRLVTVSVTGPDELGPRVVHAQQAATEHDARGVFWLDLRDDDEYLVYLYVPERAAVLRRRVPAASASVETAIEAMWLIVRSGSLAMAMGADPGMEALDPDEVAASIEAATPPSAEAEADTDKSRETEPDGRPNPQRAPPRDGIGLSVSLSYLGGGLGRRVAWQSGAAVELAYALHRHVRLGVAYGVLAGSPVREPTELRILRHELAVVLGVGGAVHRRMRIEGRLLPAVELASWRAPDDGAAGLEVFGKAAAELLVRIELVPRLRLDVGGGAALAFNDFDFVVCAEQAAVCDDDARRVVLSPWRIRPRGRIGLTTVF